ncbi:LysR family transcriptional regulator [Mitsuokella sp.]|uniref:LysR family transcriptional regulator n=1 Tax=Mitsuokella sp. TaxID=2049034 RepID=UPI003D7DA5AE
MIDEHEWRSILQVAKDGTFSAAAKHLYISQPSLSQCIKKVETELGVRLFDRSQTPLTLTPAGKIYVRQAREILRIQKSLVQEVADLSELRTGSLTIGSSRTRSACFLIKPLVAFHQQYPGIHLSVREAPVRTLEEYAASGDVDFALLYGTSGRRDLVSIPLCRERILLAVPKTHPLAARKSENPAVLPRISFAELSDEPFIKLQPFRQMADVFDKLCLKTGTEPHVIFEANSIIEAAELCASGLGATLVTDMLVRSWRWREEAVFFELEEEVAERELLAVYSKRRHLSLAAQKFIEFLRVE